ncbi:TonB-dependent receptor [Puteibacter caeruleilacunae]|nr:TonB-dependent receptor [Puteibacter caeruleilacunae]
MRFLNLFVALLFIQAQLFATNVSEEPVKITKASVSGTVSCDGEHLPFVTIMVKGSSIGTATDSEGNFKLKGLPEGDHTIIIQAVGYERKEVTIHAGVSENSPVELSLQEDVIGLDQVVITADRNEKNRREATTIVSTISPKLFERTQSVTLSEGLNFTPGLRLENDCQNCGFTQVRMNGMEGPYSQILVNSRPIFSGLAGVYGLELIPASMIERVEVVRGGGSAMYGSNAIAGTINLITKDPINNSFEVSTNNGFVGVGVDGAGDAAFDHSLSFNTNIVSDDFKTGLAMFGFHRDKEAFDANDDSFTELSELKNSTLGFRAYHKTSDRSKLTIDYFNINEDRRGGNDLNLPEHQADIAEAITHKINTAAIAWDMFMAEHNKLSIYFSGQHVDRDTYYGAGKDLSAYGKTKDFSFSTGIQYTHHFDKFFGAHAHLTTGIENNGGNLKDKKLGYYDIKEDVHEPNKVVADQKSNTFGFYAQNEWKWNKATLSAGFRIDHYKITDDAKHEMEDGEEAHGDTDGTVFSPRVTFLYNFMKELQGRVSYSRGYRAPQIFDEDLHIESSEARTVVHKNDPNLKQETSQSITASLDFSPKIGEMQTELLIEGFYTKLEDPFANEQGDMDENRQIEYTRINAEDGAKVQGVNIEFNAVPSRELQIQLGLTLQKSEYESEQDEFDEKRFFRVPDTYGFATINWAATKKFNIAVSGNYTGSMLVPYYGPNVPNIEPDKIGEVGELRESDSFMEVGTKFSYDIKLSKSLKMALSAGVKNIFNSYQDDFDKTAKRDPGYIYGPNQPRSIYVGVAIKSF